MRSVLASVFLIGICIGLLIALGGTYLGIACLAAFLAVTSGVYVSLAIALGLVWPVLSLAFVQYVLKNVLRAQELARAAPFGGSKTVLPGVEDPQHRERRDQDR